jgi:alpha-tubulin suppressor-like RCC1 family protein
MKRAYSLLVLGLSSFLFLYSIQIKAAITGWSFTDQGFIAGGQNGATRSYSDPGSVSHSPWTKSADNLTLQLNFEPDGLCSGYNQFEQVATGMTTLSFTSTVRVQMDWAGMVEQRNAGYDLLQIFADGSPIVQAESQGLNNGCGFPMVSAVPFGTSSPSPSVAYLASGSHDLTLSLDTVDEKYHSNAYYHVTFSFTTVTNFTAQAKLSSGLAHTLALAVNGTVWAWGWNQYGQLGDGTANNRTTPVQVPGLSNIIAVAAGGDHSLAIKSDGTVWAWGLGFYGELGTGNTNIQYSPVRITTLSNAVAIAAGTFHSLVLTTDNLYAFGYNAMGQLGDNTQINRSSPVVVAHGDGVYYYNVQAIEAGFYHSLALQGGRVYGWGYNAQGAVGDGTTTERHVPTLVSTLYNVTAISAGCSFHSLALDDEGDVWAWGYNAYGQLGLNSTSNEAYPQGVPGLSGVTAISAGTYHSLALISGDVYSWGYNAYGQLGNGSNTDSHSPIQVTSLSGVQAIEGGGYFSMASQFMPTSVQAWGADSLGQLGFGSTTDSWNPVPVSNFQF